MVRGSTKTTTFNNWGSFSFYHSTGQNIQHMRVNESRAVFLLLSPLPIITAWLRFPQPETLQLENLVPLHAPPETAVPADRTRANLARSSQQRILLIKYIYIWSSTNMYCSTFVVFIRLNPHWCYSEFSGKRLDKDCCLAMRIIIHIRFHVVYMVVIPIFQESSELGHG